MYYHRRLSVSMFILSVVRLKFIEVIQDPVLTFPVPDDKLGPTELLDFSRPHELVGLDTLYDTPTPLSLVKCFD